MHTLIRSVCGIGIAVLLGAASTSYAESAPVYDADNMQQQFEAEPSYQDLPPPPPPGQEGAYVPNHPAAAGGVDQRLRRMEQQINNMQNGDTSPRIDSLQQQVQSLRGQVEQLTHQLQQLQEQVKTQYADIDKRLSQTGAAKPVAPAAAVSNTPPNADSAVKSASKPAKTPAPNAPQQTADAATSADQPNVAEEQQIYQTAYNLIKAKRYDDAVNTLQGMLKKYPSGQFASNAHYWLGELYGLMGKNDQALTEFNTVLRSYPDSPRVSDAQLKVGLIFAAQSKWTDAKAAFKKVINRYPGSASARVATEHLKEIKSAGN